VRNFIFGDGTEAGKFHSKVPLITDVYASELVVRKSAVIFEKA
jgi:hypothetical protein